MTGRAIQLITEKNGNFEITEESVDFLKNISPPFAVIAVCGPYRTGKSYLLNRFLGKQKGFGVGSTVNPETRGIYLWNELIEIVRPDTHEVVPCLIIDTEGIASVQQERNHDVKIFSLSLLLCEYLVYNTMGVIDETAVDTLSLISEVAKMLSAKAEGGSSRNSDVPDFFPCFAWVLRDFVLDLKDEQGHEITPNQYLELALKDRNEKNFIEKNKIRRALRNYFPERDCFCLVRPTSDEKDLRHIDEIPQDRLRKSFVEGVDSLLKTVKMKLPVKKLYRSPISGEAFVSLLKSYVDSINSGSIPKITDSWKGVATLENHKILQKQVERTKEELKEVEQKFPIEPDELSAYQNELRKYSRSYLQTNLLGEETQQYLLEFETALDDYCLQSSSKNVTLSFKKCESLFNTIYAQQVVLPLRQKQFKTIKEFVEARERALLLYDESAVGGSKAQVVASLFPTKCHESCLEFFDQVRESYQPLLEECKKQEEKLKSDLRQSENTIHEQTLESTKLSMQIQMEQQENSRLNLSKSALQIQINQLNSNIEELHSTIKRLQEELTSLRELERQHQKLQLQYSLLQTNYSNQEQVKQQLQLDLEDRSQKLFDKDKQIQEISLAKKNLKRQLKEVVDARERLQGQLRETGDERDQLRTHTKEEREQLQNQLRETTVARESLEAQLNDSQREKERIERQLAEVVEARERLQGQLSDDREQFRAQTRELMDERDQLRTHTKEEREQLQNQFRETTVESESLKSQLNDSQRERERLERQLAEFVDAKEKLLKETGDEREQLRDQTRELTVTRDELQKTLEETITAKDELLSKVGELKGEIDRLGAINERLKEEHQQLDRHHNDEIMGLKQETEQQLQICKDRIEKLSSTLQMHQQNQCDSERSASMLIEQLTHLQTDLAEKERNFDLQKLQLQQTFEGQRSELLHQLERQTQQIDKLGELLHQSEAEVRRLNESIAIRIDEETSLKEQREQHQQQEEAAAAAASLREEQNGKLRESLQRSETEVLRLNEAIARINEETSCKEAALREEQKEQEKKHDIEKEALEKSVALLEQKVATQKEIETLEVLNTKKQFNNITVRAATAASATTASATTVTSVPGGEKGESENWKRKMVDMEKENNSLLKQRENLNFEKKGLEDRLVLKEKEYFTLKKALEKEKKELISENSQLETLLKKKRHQVDALDKKDIMIEELEKRIKIMSSQLEEWEKKEERGRKEKVEKNTSSERGDSPSPPPPVHNKPKRKRIEQQQAQHDYERDPETLTIAEIKRIFTKHRKENLLTTINKTKGDYVELYRQHIKNECC